MARRLIWLGLFGAAAICAGCRACPNHLDYLGPVDGGPTGHAALLYRKNSVLGGDPAMTPLPKAPGVQAIEEPNGTEE